MQEELKIMKGTSKKMDHIVCQMCERKNKERITPSNDTTTA